MAKTGKGNQLECEIIDVTTRIKELEERLSDAENCRADTLAENVKLRKLMQDVLDVNFIAADTALVDALVCMEEYLAEKG